MLTQIERWLVRRQVQVAAARAAALLAAEEDAIEHEWQRIRRANATIGMKESDYKAWLRQELHRA